MIAAGAVDTTEAERHNHRLLELMQSHTNTAIERVKENLVLDTLARTPTIDEEYALLMMGEGEEPLVPRAGGRSADTDGRTRLEKAEDTYLEATVAAPANAFTWHNGMQFWVFLGNLEWLEQNAYFQYRNKRRLSKNEYAESETYVKGPYFQAFEFGSFGDSALVRPAFVLENGHLYPLRPGEGEDGERHEMYKPIYPHNMFARELLDVVATVSITTALAELGPGRENPL